MDRSKTTPMNLSQRIDHTILSPLSRPDEVAKYCQESLNHQFAGVCIPPFFVKTARSIIKDAPVNIVTVAGFPFGYSHVAAKIEEMKKAFVEGADEVDAMVNLCAIKSEQWGTVKNEIESMVTMCHMKGKILKLIVETAQLSEDELRHICELSVAAEVDFIKTSSGVIGPGASIESVSFLRNILPPEVRVKASGDIRDRNFAEALVAAGADRIGTSVGVQLIAN